MGRFDGVQSPMLCSPDDARLGKGVLDIALVECGVENRMKASICSCEARVMARKRKIESACEDQMAVVGSRSSSWNVVVDRKGAMR